jgi:glutamate formiminotransferase
MLIGGRAQVSMNLTDHRATPIHRAFEMVVREAAARGIAVVESELVGMIPEDALIDTARFYLRLPGIQPSQILEQQILTAQREHS